jgi:hypothetical protein
MLFLLMSLILAFTTSRGSGFCISNVDDEDKAIMMLALIVFVIEASIQGVIWWTIFK